MLFVNILELGGGNREYYQTEIEELQKMDGYITDFDDDFDSTFATFVFKVPQKYEEDYKKILDSKLTEISEEYKKELYRVYPKLKDKLDEIFKKD